MENMIIYKCEKCNKKYKKESSLQKHLKKCKPVVEIVDKPEDKNIVNSENDTENNYDVNMTFLDDDKIEVEVKKQVQESLEGENELKELLKPKVSESYRDEINKLQDLINMFKNLPIPESPENKDATIDQLKNILTITMSQSQNLIKEMEAMSRRNSFYKNNIMLASWLLDKCRKEVPESDEEFENLF